ncbi:MAG: DUF481 domain-containing protein [Myxococcota bacterium]
MIFCPLLGQIPTVHLHVHASWLRVLVLFSGIFMSVTTAVAEGAHDEAISDEAPESDETSLSVGAGANLNTGNTQSWTANVGTEGRIARDMHELSVLWNFNYGRADVAGDNEDGFVDTVRNSVSRIRYDIYFTAMDASVVGLVHRWDTFAGLDTRLSVQGGYLRNFLKRDKLRLWAESGYDFTYDDFTAVGDEVLQVESQNVHSARLYFGYDNALNAAVQLSLGVEGLLNVEDLEDLRVNGNAAVRSSISEIFQLEVKFSLLFDNVPVEGAESLDTTTVLSLICNLL